SSGRSSIRPARRSADQSRTAAWSEALSFRAIFVLPCGFDGLFPNAEVAEDHVENILDVDPAGQLAECMRRGPELLGHQVLAAGNVLAARALKRTDGCFQRPAVALARHQRRFAAEPTLGLFAQGREQGVKSGAILGRKTEYLLINIEYRFISLC